MGDSAQGSSPGVIRRQSIHVCHSDLDTAAEKTCSWDLSGSCSREGWPRKCLPTMPALVQHLKVTALNGCGSESSQLTHHRASKSFPPRESRQPAYFLYAFFICVFMPSALSMCPFPDNGHSGAWHTPSISSYIRKYPISK